MTITRISPGVWELRSRHGTLIAPATSAPS
jgi:hypothetical protein